MTVRKPLLPDIEVHLVFKKRPQNIFQKFQKFFSEKNEQDVSHLKQHISLNELSKHFFKIGHIGQLPKYHKCMFHHHKYPFYT